jgi:hypothetical protein
MAQANFRDEELKSITASDGSARVTLILINDDDVLAGPAQIDRTLHEIILTSGTARVVAHLDQGGLPDVDESLSIKMVRPDFVGVEWGEHDQTPFGATRIE